MPVDDFEDFFTANYEAVVQALRIAVGDAARAEEAAQEAFARAWARWRRVRAMDRPVAWVYVVALNVERKRWRRASELLVEPFEVACDPTEQAARDFDLRAAVKRLPERQRAAIALRYLADLPVADLARAMGCADGTVKATVHQALRSLRISLEDARED